MTSSNLAWLKSLFMKDKGIKILSLILAVLAWYAISGSVSGRGAEHGVPTLEFVSTRRTLNYVPVSAIVRPGASLRVDLRPQSVKVILAGESSVLHKLAATDIRAVVDCSRLRSPTNDGVQVVVSVPRGLDLTAVAKPATVRVVFSPER